MLIYAIEAPSIEDASNSLSFTPIASEVLGQPIHVFVSDPAAIPMEDRAINLLYKHPIYGSFALIEELSHTTQAELEALADTCDPKAGCEGTWTIVMIRGSIKALLVNGPGSTAITWLEGPLRIDLLGPPDTFSSSEAIDVANET